MKKVFIAATLAVLSGCSAEDSMHYLLETTMTLQFTATCGENSSCVQVVDSHMEACYTKDATMAMLTAGTEEASNAQFMKNVQQVHTCLAEKGGEDYWKDVDWSEFMPPAG